jgi:hypothetical protein
LVRVCTISLFGVLAAHQAWSLWRAGPVCLFLYPQGSEGKHGVNVGLNE